MLTFLFWNLKSRNARILASLVRQHAVDVLILAECPMLPAIVLEELNRSAAEYYLAESQCERIQLYTRFPGEQVLPIQSDQAGRVFEGDYYSIRRLARPGQEELLLCAVHFPSKLWQKEESDRTGFTMPFARELAEAEIAVNHRRTVLIGDLNMNPYEDTVVTAQGLHAVMSRRIACKQTRWVNNFESNPFFFNPMWSHFGERKEGHAGSYYYSSPKARADYWNIYDQVLVRPALLPYFQDEDVVLLCRDSVDKISLLGTDGAPDKERFSDHLPLLFRLHI